MITCPKCDAKGKYYYEGLFIRYTACGYTEGAKKKVDGHLTRLWDNWKKKEVKDD